MVEAAQDAGAYAAGCRNADNDQAVDTVIAQPGFQWRAEEGRRLVLQDDHILLSRRVGIRPLVGPGVAGVFERVGIAEFQVPDAALGRVAAVVAAAVVDRQAQPAKRLRHPHKVGEQRLISLRAQRIFRVDEIVGGVDVQQRRTLADADFLAEAGFGIGLDLRLGDQVGPAADFGVVVVHRELRLERQVMAI